MHVPGDAYDYGERASSEAHGVVLTKPHVVELILDLAGYSTDRDLGALRLLEPSCGHGAFLAHAVERLLRSAETHRRHAADLRSAILAYDVDADHVARSRQTVRDALRRNGCPGAEAASLARSWVRRGDFLLTRHETEFDAIVGNPPYVRIEQIHPELQRIYRARFKSLSHRADLYVAFVERCLRLLSPEGVLSMICADRWTLNKYGAPLRRILAESFKVRCYLDLHQASPFESEVIAYPGIFAISRGNSERVLVGRLIAASPEECRKVRGALEASHRRDSLPFSVYTSWFRDDEPWVLSSPEHLAALRDLEARFRPLEEYGETRVGIGVATGNDKVYIVDQNVDVEPDRLVPLVMRADLRDGKIRDASHFVINPFCNDNGGLVDLRKYPRLASYVMKHAEEIQRRHVARKNPGSWFRTIDRVYPKLVTTPKLLIPDIAGTNEVTYDVGKYHPHHNLYYITSKSWDLEVLGGLLSSKTALFFIRSYAVKMHSGYLRFQAQYLRRIRVPMPNEISKNLSRSIRAAYRQRDFERLDDLALAAYGITGLPEVDFIDVRRLT